MSYNSEAYFPLFISLKLKKILVFGGGNIATRRIKTLLDFGAEVEVIAPEFTKEIADLAKQQKLSLEQRRYMSGEITNPFFVLAATDKQRVNDEIYLECKEKGIPVNVVSDQTKCDFFFPGIIKEETLVIGVTASGKDHKRVREITDQIKRVVKGENR